MASVANIVVDNRSSAMPPAAFPITFAVAGAIRKRSAHLARLYALYPTGPFFERCHGTLDYPKGSQRLGMDKFSSVVSHYNFYICPKFN